MSIGTHLLRQKFTRQSRLLRPADFKRVFEQPYRSGDNCFRILARPNGILSHRLGMAVAKKAIPHAVGRNRIKRLVRESFRKQMVGQTAGQMIGRPVGEALDFVVLPTAQAGSQTNKALVESLSVHWQKLNSGIKLGKPTKDTR